MLTSRSGPASISGVYFMKELIRKSGCTAAECVAKIKKRHKETYQSMNDIVHDWNNAIIDILNAGGTEIPLDLDSEINMKYSIASIANMVNSQSLLGCISTPFPSVTEENLYSELLTRNNLANVFYTLKAYEYACTVEENLNAKNALVAVIREEDGKPIGLMSDFVSLNNTYTNIPIKFSLWTLPEIESGLYTKVENLYDKWKQELWHWVATGK